MRQKCEVGKEMVDWNVSKGQSNNENKFYFMRMLITYNFGHLEYSPDELVRADSESDDNMFCL